MTQNSTPENSTTQDSDSKIAEYAHPERLVTTAWLAERIAPFARARLLN